MSFSSIKIVGAVGNSDVAVELDNISYGTAVVPEPTTLALMGLRLADNGWKRRKAAYLTLGSQYHPGDNSLLEIAIIDEISILFFHCDCLICNNWCTIKNPTG